MKIIKRLLPIFTVTTLLGLVACSGNDCYENHSALPLAAFYNSATMQPVTLNQVEIYGIGAPGDSVLYTPQNLGQAYLPFRIWEDTTSYVIAYAANFPDSIAVNHPERLPSDTITFFYTPKEWFVSPGCGAMYNFEMKEVKHTSFLLDSVSYDELITNENIVNIKMFFREAIIE